MTIRIWVGIVTAVVLSLLGAMDFYQLAAAARKHTPDPYLVATQLQRYEPVKQAVGEGVRLGYISNLAFETTRGSMMFYLAQYALAPRLVLVKPEGEWVLGDFTAKMDYEAKGKEHGLAIAQDFGDGLILYRRGKK
ncbi:MAG: hypothetical protein JJE04_18850 [Acidobacteriia bacterium]|nr:hypothetical protein [Terriglobia bacterium]